MSGNTTLNARILLSARNTTGPVLNAFKGNLHSLGSAVTGVHSQLLSLAGIGGFGYFISQTIDVNKQMQNLKSSLKTVTGGTLEADKAFDQIEKFATTTPYELEQVVDSFIKLKALGLDPSERALNSYGNTASAMGKSLNQMIEAVADASTGEFERLKEFGIKSSRQGDQIKFTFQGVTTSIKNNSTDIQEYLLAIGENQFAGAMTDKMNNIEAALSNMRAAMKGLQVDIGEAGLNQLITMLAKDTTEWINSLDKQQVQDFTKMVISSFADLIDGVDTAANYVSNNPFLAEAGLVGYMIFGKRGIALAGAVDWATNKIGAAAASVWEAFNPSQINSGVGGFGGTNGSEIGKAYALGDFNNKAMGRGQAFDDMKMKIRGGSRTEVADRREAEKAAGLLSHFAEKLRAIDYDKPGPTREDKLKEKIYREDQVAAQRRDAERARKDETADALLKRALGFDNQFSKTPGFNNGSLQGKTHGSLDRLIINPGAENEKVIIDKLNKIDQTNELLNKINDTLSRKSGGAIAG